LKFFSFPALLVLWLLALAFGLWTRPGIRGDLLQLDPHTIQAEIQPGLVYPYTLVLEDSDRISNITLSGHRQKIEPGTIKVHLQIPRGLCIVRLIFQTQNPSNLASTRFTLPLPERPWIHLLPWILISILLIYRFLRTRISIEQAKIFSVSALITTLWTFAIPWSQFSLDAYSHRTYVLDILKSHAIPPPDACSLCYHPPLYHVLAAIVLGSAQTIGIQTGRVLELFSLGMLLVGIWLGLEAIRILFSVAKARPLQWIFALCPQIWILSGRLNNDVLIFLLGSISFYFWTQSTVAKSSKRDLILAGVSAGLMCWTKGNGLVWVMMLAWISGTWNWKNIGATSGLILLISAFPFVLIGVTFSGIRSHLASHGGDLVVGNIADQFVNDHSFPVHFSDLWKIHWKSLMDSPFAVLQDGKYFLNTLVKNIAFGEFPLLPFSLAPLAYPGLIIVLLLGLELIRISLRFPFRCLSWGPVCALGIAALAVARVRYPFPTSQDPRYVVFLIYPILLGLSNLETRRLERYARYWTIIFTGISLLAIAVHH
jgi:hypothetical protein